MSGVLDQLRECKWRNKGYPLSSLRTTLTQDLAEHKYWGQDGARVESTGRAPVVIDVTIPFRNGIAKAQAESWSTLYPTAYRAFLTDAADKSIGVFDHPELGEITCKVRSVDSSWDPNRRDGVDVHAVFVETRIQNDTSSVVGDPSPVTFVVGAAVDLDTMLPMINRPAGTAYMPNFADSVRSVVAVGDKVSLLQQQIGGAFTQLSYRAQQIENSVNGIAPPLTPLGTATTSAKTIAGSVTNISATASKSLMWPITVACERLKNAANNNTRGKLLQNQQGVSFYIVPAPTTLAAIVTDLSESTLNDLTLLNPTLLAKPAVERGTVVRYYTPKKK